MTGRIIPYSKKMYSGSDVMARGGVEKNIPVSPTSWEIFFLLATGILSFFVSIFLE